MVGCQRNKLAFNTMAKRSKLNGVGITMKGDTAKLKVELKPTEECNKTLKGEGDDYVRFNGFGQINKQYYAMIRVFEVGKPKKKKGKKAKK
jgi:hypothetical protein